MIEVRWMTELTKADEWVGWVTNRFETLGQALEFVRTKAFDPKVRFLSIEKDAAEARPEKEAA